MHCFNLRGYKNKLVKIGTVIAVALFSVPLIAQSLVFNQTEQTYLNQHKIIHYCIDPDWLPIEGIVNGQHQGLSADYIALFQQLTGVDFRLTPTQSWVGTLDKFRRQECDIIPMLNSSAERNKYINFTSVYVTAPAAIVSLKDNDDIQTLSDLGGKTLALTRGYRYQEVVTRDYPDITLVMVESEREALRLVARGHVYAMAGSLLLIIREMEQLRASNLLISGAPNLNDKLRLGVNPDDPVLRGIMQKVIDSISNTQHDNILKRWGVVSYSDGIGLSDVWLWIVAGLAIILFLAFRYYALAMHSVMLDSKNFELDLKNKELVRLQEQLSKRNKKLEYLSTHDSLTSLVNRNYFEDLVKKELNRAIRHNTTLSLMLIDLDSFKLINDTYGHSVGDKVLIETANILKSQVRSIDAVGRWGGEEFIILLPETSLSDAAALAERICQAVAASHIVPVGHITCSIGVSLFKDGNTLDNVFLKADKALYQAKEKGRNRIEVVD